METLSDPSLQAPQNQGKCLDYCELILSCTPSVINSAVLVQQAALSPVISGDGNNEAENDGRYIVNV